MRFACLVYFEESALDQLSRADLERLRSDATRFDVGLEANAQLVFASPLQRTETAVTVRMRDGRMSATDGPFMETREALGGFFLIEARDMAEAVRIASDSPLAKYGPIEVRPMGEPERPNG